MGPLDVPALLEQTQVGALTQQPAWANGALMQQFANQRAALPRPNVTDVFGYGPSWQTYLSNFANNLNSKTPNLEGLGPQAISSLIGTLGFAPLGITAYHGSPHSFDVFDKNKIGSGEGAQAYGRGLYFAENPDVARSYQFAGRAAYTNNRVAEMAYRASDATGGSPAAAKEWLYKRGLEAPQEYKQMYFDAMNNYDTFQKQANLYKVEIPDDAVGKMLDWDKPLSQQPTNVQDAAKKLRYLLPREGEATMGDVMKRVKAQGDPEEDMVAAGIPGIRYLDQLSRSSGEGTRNYVVFDDKLPKIVEKK